MRKTEPDFVTHRNEVIRYVEERNAENLLEESLVADQLYYKATIKPPR